MKKLTGIELITVERSEQKIKHGFSLEHDQYYSKSQLVQAAEFCIEQSAQPKEEKRKWPKGWDKYFEDKIRNKTKMGKLIVAGAFYMAEDDRIGHEFYNGKIQQIAEIIDKLIAEKDAKEE